MSEQTMENEKLTNETQEVHIVEDSISVNVSEEDNAENAVIDTPATAKPPMSKKQRIIIAAAAIVVIAILLVIFIPSKFQQVRKECSSISRVTYGNDYFMIDTYPDDYVGMDAEILAMLLPGTQERALKAIRHASAELGFNGSVYSQMMSTSALMGSQSAETNKYRVSWSYHPDAGLEVTYEKK